MSAPTPRAPADPPAPPRAVVVAFALIALLLIAGAPLALRLRAVGLLLRFERALRPAAAAPPAAPPAQGAPPDAAPSSSSSSGAGLARLLAPTSPITPPKPPAAPSGSAPSPLAPPSPPLSDAALEALTRSLESLALNPVDEASFDLRLGDNRARARVYEPRGRASPPALVLAHGVHRLGIDEPRLVALARSFSAAGLRVLTPELSNLADYHIDKADADTIGEASLAFAPWCGRKQVGFVGVSFAGSLGLLAALDERYARAFAFVGTVGSYSDLAQTLRFLATNEARGPDGKSPGLVAHDYGALVLAYDHADEFFAPEDREPARKALRLRLHERHDESLVAAESPDLSPDAASTLRRLFKGWDEPLRQRFLAAIEHNREKLDALSPGRRLGGLGPKAFFLHSADDNVIPPTETEWLASALPAGRRGAVLLSRAMAHANLKGGGLGERWALVEWMAAVLDAAEHEPIVVE